ncbi:LTA synthase family protein [Paenibacillus polygoni]|uniref:LTA synthase family protein n=1 Tax=Paenibacillus polygoni TaxID=3050112 RepID=A0ABY8X6F7_9BACL|nr:LTA synthase family protein [Paenibacillus polygoni]WIV20623.1 LTA synthase family protein [Paenibacillus polygoni]
MPNISNPILVSHSKKFTWLRSYLPYLLFLIIMILKLRYFHDELNARDIDMSRTDYIIAAGSLLIVSFWVLWLPVRIRIFTLSLLNLLLTGIIFADLVYYRYFGDFITVPVLLQTGQVGSLGDSIRSLIYSSDLWFFIDLILLAIGGLFYVIHLYRKSRKNRSSLYAVQKQKTTQQVSKRSRFVSGVLALVLGIVLTVGPIQHSSKTWAAGLFEGNWWNMTLYNVTGLLAFHGYDVYRYNKERMNSQAPVSHEQLEETTAYFSEKQEEARQATSAETFGKYKGKNVIIVQVEAFMNFVIGKEIGGEEITPHFNNLMKESLYFKNFYHQTGQGRTSDADFVTNISLHPLPTGSVFVRYPDHEYDALSSILGSEGYHTAAYHAYESSFWNRYMMYKNMGYDEFKNRNNYIMNEAVGWSLGDKSFFKQSVDYITEEQLKNPAPFYSFMTTLTSHHPYGLPASLRELNTDSLGKSMMGNYLQSIHYVDAALGELVEQLKKEGLWDDTLLVVYGDHDNSIKEKADYETFLGTSLSDLEMHQIMNQVPLLMHLPDGDQAGIYLEPAGQIDIAPTVLHLLGISTEDNYLMGSDLLSTSKRMTVLRSGAFANRDLVYIPSEDRRFENGSCYEMPAGKQTDIQACKPSYEKSKLELSISDQLITHNLIHKLRAKE